MGSMKPLSGERMRDDPTAPCCAAGYNRRWGVTDQAYFLLFGSLHAGIGRLALMPLVVLASRICPKVKPAQHAPPSHFPRRETMQSPFYMMLPWCAMKCVWMTQHAVQGTSSVQWIRPNSGWLNPKNWHEAWC